MTPKVWIRLIISQVFPLTWSLLLPSNPAIQTSQVLLGLLIIPALFRTLEKGPFCSQLFSSIGTGIWFSLGFLFVNVSVLYPLPLYLHWQSDLAGALEAGPLGALVLAGSGILAQSFNHRRYSLGDYIPVQVFLQALLALAMGGPWFLGILGGSALIFLGIKTFCTNPKLTWKSLIPRLGALGLLVLILLPLGLIQSAQKPGQPGFSRILLFPGFRQWAQQNFPQLSIPPLMGAGAYGYSSGDLTTPFNQGKKVLFTIQGKPGQRLYLRDRIFSTYVRGRWQVPDLKPQEPSPNPGNLIPEAKLTWQRELVQELFATQETQWIETQESRSFFPGNSNQGWFSEEPLYRGDTWTLLKSPEKPLLPGSKDLEPWTERPLGLSPRWIALAQELSGPTPEETVEKISRYLDQGFFYDKTVTNPDRSDPLEEFLFKTHKGFCAHFASSAVLLCRLNGLPARYITGFALKLDFKGQAGAYPELFHAWAEVFIPNKGWEILETTPPYRDDQLPSGIANSAAQETDGIPTPGPARESKTPSIDNGFLSWAGVFIALGALVILGVILYRSTGTRPLRRLVSLWNERGLPGPEILGWTGWTQGVSKQIQGLANGRILRILTRKLLLKERLSPRERRYAALWIQKARKGIP